MLTRNGWLTAGLALTLFAAGRMLGIYEMYLLGGAAAGLVLVAAVYVGLVRLRLRVTRHVRPYRIHSGSAARVDLEIHNLGRRTPLLRLRDSVTGTRGADLSAGPLNRSERTVAAYRVPTDTRGIVEVGPLYVEITDPFRLALVRVKAADVTDITVFPRVEAVKAVPFTIGHDPHGAANNANSLGRLGDDFYALRHYTVGDDLRRVHWPSTARTGELMVRHDELPWQGRATLVLDCRIRSHSPESFEASVSAVASILSACARRRDLVRVVTTDGGDSGFATGNAHVDAIMEYLATVQLSERGTLHGALATLRRSTDGGALVVVGGPMETADVDAALRLRTTFSAVYAVRFAPGPAGATDFAAHATTVGTITDPDRFADEWKRLIAQRVSPVGVSGR